jgi:hypothetical protein
MRTHLDRRRGFANTQLTGRHGTFEGSGNPIVGRVQLSYDDENRQDEFQTAYRRV